jgi:hypothetical protein
VKGRKRIRSADDSRGMYAALDLHKKYSNAVVMNADGVVLREERFENDPRRDGKLLQQPS